MDLKNQVGVSIQPVRIDPDGASAPPEVVNLSPPSDSPESQDSPSDRRIVEATRLEGLEAPAEAPSEPESETPSSEQRAAAGIPRKRGEVLGSPKALVGWFYRQRALLVAALASSALASALSVLFLPEPEAPTATTETSEATPNSAKEPPSSASDGTTAGAETPTASDTPDPPEKQPQAKTNAQPPLPRGSKEDEAPEEDLWTAAPPLPPAPCIRQLPPNRLLGNVRSDFPLEVIAVPNDILALIGYSEREGEALGIQVNATSLTADVIFRDSGKRALLGIVPRVVKGKPTFAVDRVSIGGHREWRSLPGDRGLALTRTNQGLHLIRQEDYRMVSLWPMPAEEELSRARIARSGLRHYVFAFRQGGPTGTVSVGWLDAKSLRRSRLRELPVDAEQVGIPSVAAREKQALVAVAVREKETSPWRLELIKTHAKRGSEKLVVRGLTEDVRGDHLKPSVAALSGDRWLVQWTEGKPDQQRVRALTLDTNFQPMGKRIDISPREAIAVASSLARVDKGVLSTFLIQRQSVFELWGATLACD